MEQSGKSEVARQLEQIALEYEAAQRGLAGLAQGTSRHAFIAARMRRMGQIHQEIQRLVGPEQAIQLVADTIFAQTSAEHDREKPHRATADKDGERMSV
jgi:hypothetical protein